MTSEIFLDAESFSDSVQKYLRASGFSQKELADELHLHPKVLSRKLHGYGHAHVTHLEVQRIILILARWHVLARQDEALHLLELARMAPTIFSAEEWQQPPLGALAAQDTPPQLPYTSRLPASPSQHNLPAPANSMIGREWAVARLRQLLGRDGVRLVTLVGPGGSGKTRLAMHVASELVGMFAQGVCFVDLSGVSEPALVPITIMQAMNLQSAPGVPPIQSLITCIRNKQLLLLLDNFEQVAEAVAVVDELLSAAPHLKMLVTSRVVLRLYGEQEFSVPPLDVPDPHTVLDIRELSHYEAIQMFVQRAQEVNPDFELTRENAGDVACICARVDGLPLALELAAARVKVLPTAQLLEQLSTARLPILTGKARNRPRRQQTLRNTITWSYDLLTSDEQAWLRRVGVFAGGWSLEAAASMMQAVTAGADDTDGAHKERTPISISPVDMLQQLVDNSLVTRLPDVSQQARYRMLETLREFALEQLSQQGEHERLRDWHACYYLRKAEAAELGLRGPQQRLWLARLKADRDNFRAALEWSLNKAREGKRIATTAVFARESPGERGSVAGSRTLSAQGNPGADMAAIELCLRLAAALRASWEWQGQLTEARLWLGAALSVTIEDGAGRTTLAAQAKALSESARLVSLQNDQARAIELAEQSIALWRQLDDPVGLATALLHRGWPAHALGDYETTRRVDREGMQHLSVAEDPWLYAQLLFYLGDAAAFAFDFEEMRACLTQCKAIFEQLGDTCAVADVLKDWGGLSILESNYSQAIDFLLESIRLCYELDHRQFIATGMGSLSFAFGVRGEPDPTLASIYSAQLGGAAESMMDAIGLTPWTKTLPLVKTVRQLIRERVDEHSWEAAWATGRALTIKQAIDLAYRLGEGSHPQQED